MFYYEKTRNNTLTV